MKTVMKDICSSDGEITLLGSEVHGFDFSTIIIIIIITTTTTMLLMLMMLTNLLVA